MCQSQRAGVFFAFHGEDWSLIEKTRDSTYEIVDGP